MPRSASTSAPASRTHSPLSLAAVHVKPALVEPIPVVKTEREVNWAAKRRN